MLPSISGRAPEVLAAAHAALASGQEPEVCPRKKAELESMSDAALLSLWQRCKLPPVEFNRSEMIRRLLIADVQLMSDYSPAVLNPS